MNKITGRELDPNQFPAWAEFTPSSESLTKVSAREGFQIDLGNPLTLEDLSLTSLGVSGLSTLHDIDIKDSSETVILQRNGSTLETLIDQGGTPTMARVGAGIIESGEDGSGSWYRIYGDGWAECGGGISGSPSSMTAYGPIYYAALAAAVLTFPVEFASSPRIRASLTSNNGVGGVSRVVRDAIGITSMIVWNGTSGVPNYGVDWRAEGWLA